MHVVAGAEGVVAGAAQIVEDERITDRIGEDVLLCPKRCGNVLIATSSPPRVLISTDRTTKLEK